MAKSLHKPSKLMLLLGGIFTAVGLMLLSLAVWQTVTSARKLARYERTTATVIDYQEKKSYNSDTHRTTTLYAEIVQFTVDGQTYTVTDSSSSTNPRALGASVEIAYNPDYPADCIFVRSNTVLVIVLYAAGILFPGAGIAVLIDYVKTNRAYIRQETREDFSANPLDERPPDAV